MINVFYNDIIRKRVVVLLLQKIWKPWLSQLKKYMLLKKRN